MEFQAPGIIMLATQVTEFLTSLVFKEPAHRVNAPFCRNLGAALKERFFAELDNVTKRPDDPKEYMPIDPDTGQLVGTIQVNYFGASIKLEPIYSGHLVRNVQLDHALLPDLWTADEQDRESNKITQEHAHRSDF